MPSMLPIRDSLLNEERWEKMLHTAENRKKSGRAVLTPEEI